MFILLRIEGEYGYQLNVRLRTYVSSHLNKLFDMTKAEPQQDGCGQLKIIKTK